jgi:hypothetical protein
MKEEQETSSDEDDNLSFDGGESDEEMIDFISEEVKGQFENFIGMVVFKISLDVPHGNSQLASFYYQLEEKHDYWISNDPPSFKEFYESSIGIEGSSVILGLDSACFYKTLDYLHKDMLLSKPAIRLMEAILGSIAHHIATRAAEIARNNKCNQITSMAIQKAVREILPGELGKHAISEGTKACRYETVLKKNIYLLQTNSK